MNLFDIWLIVVAILYAAVSIRTRHFSRMPQLRDIPPAEGMTWPRLSLIIPACNESATIELAARKLLAQDYPDLEIILINDRSTDDTGAIINRLAAEDARVKPIHIRELPAGWLGKVHAMNRGMEGASGDWCLVTDADIHFSKYTLRKAISLCQREGFEFLTVLPDLIAGPLLLRLCLIHFAHLIAVAKPIRTTKNSGTDGVGAFLLFERSAYAKSEGFQWLKLEVIDDAASAYMMKRAGAKMGVIAGQGEIELEWYPTFRAFVHGIEKNSFAAMQYSVTALTLAISINVFFIGALFIAPFYAHSKWPAFFAWSMLLIASGTFGIQMARICRFQVWEALLSPIASLIFPLISIRSAYLTLKNGGVKWRGTFYPLADLRAGHRLNVIKMIRERKST